MKYRVYFNRPAVDDIPDNVVVPDVADVMSNAQGNGVLFVDGERKMIAFYPTHAILAVERIRD